MTHKAFRYRFYPTPEQETVLRQFCGAARFLYNLALEQRRDHRRQYRATTGHSLSHASQCRELTTLRAETDWLNAVPRSVCDYALLDLDNAFSEFFAGKRNYPGMRALGRFDSFRVKGREAHIVPLNRKWATIKIPKCAPFKLRFTRPIVGALRNVTFSHRSGAWYITCVAEQDSISSEAIGGSVGIDRGVANTFSLSTGEHYQMPAHVAVSIKKRKRAQRILCRRKKGSVRRALQRAIVAKHHAHAAAARAHWLHERSTDIAQRFGVVTLEKLRVANMTRSASGTLKEPGAGVKRKAGLNRSILEQGWSAFAAMLNYKLAERGGCVDFVNPAYTSQTCPECGSIDKRSRESQATFRCIDCGHTAHADTNAAVNILRRSPASVEGAGYGPVEARIGTMLTHRENLAA